MLKIRMLFFLIAKDVARPIEKFLNKNNIFYNDVQFILNQEMRSPEKYFSGEYRKVSVILTGMIYPVR